MERMVTEAVLKHSQKGRPRKWIPWVCLFMFLLSGLFGGYYLLLVFNDNDFSRMLISMLPQFEMMVGEYLFTSIEAFVYFFLPMASPLVLLLPFIFSMMLCHYRGVYWWFGALILIFGIAVPVFSGVYAGFLIFPLLRQMAEGNPLLAMIFGYGTVYGNIGLPFLYALFMLFGVFYNVNYPSKYERIYELRRKRIKSLHGYDERAAYKKRFYLDYKYGRWDPMMYELFAYYLDSSYRGPMPKDAFEFLMRYSEKCDGKVNRAIFVELASQGRYYECREYLRKAKEKADAVDNGAKIVLPHYEPPKPKKKKPLPKPKPVRLDPPLAPAKVQRSPNARVKTWTPDEIA